MSCYLLSPNQGVLIRGLSHNVAHFRHMHMDVHVVFMCTHMHIHVAIHVYIYTCTLIRSYSSKGHPLVLFSVKCESLTPTIRTS